MDRAAPIAAAVGLSLLYVFSGLALIILNRFILTQLQFPFPIFLSGLGVLFSALTARIIVALGLVSLQQQQIEAVEGQLWYRRVLPVGFFQACTLSLGTLVYLLLDVGFIQMLKSFTPVVVLICGYLSAVDQPSLPVIYSVLIIAAGTAATCSFNPSLNLLGLGVMFLSILSEALYLVLTQYFLQQLKFGVVEGLYVLAPASAFWLLLASLFFESRRMLQSGAVIVLMTNLHLFLLAALLGVVINFVSYGVIQSTSSLTMKILGTLRNVIIVAVGVLFFGELLPLKESAGYAVALIGFAMYNLAKLGKLQHLTMLNTSPLVLLQQLKEAATSDGSSLASTRAATATTTDTAATTIVTTAAGDHDSESQLPLLPSVAKAAAADRVATAKIAARGFLI